jgi:hypothetical protein
MPELRIPLDAICFVIVKAREFDVQEATVEEDYGANPIDEDFREVLQAYADDPTFEELKQFIDELNEDEQIDLVALTWLGRGDYTLDQWDDAVEAARDRRTGPTSTYLLGTPVLADYLQEGLAAFGLSCSDAEAEEGREADPKSIREGSSRRREQGRERASRSTAGGHNGDD